VIRKHRKNRNEEKPRGREEEKDEENISYF
jgi:hypothetical protein